MRRWLPRPIGLGAPGAVLLAATVSAAQDPPPGPQPLTVRPREMATGAQSPRAGEYALDLLPDHLVYVPQSCAGPRRCPLVVFLHPWVENSRYVMKWMSPVAEKHGLVVLAPNSRNAWIRDDVPDSIRGRTADYAGQKKIDAAMRQVLGKFAIDPDKIALIGYSASGMPAVVFGGYSLHVFSRLVIISAGYALGTGIDPRNTTSQFLVIAGLEESRGNFLMARNLREARHPVQQMVGLRPHTMKAEDFDFIGRWLSRSWAAPNSSDRPAPIVVTDSVPLLTIDVIRKMAAFWRRFQQEPDSIRMAARVAHLREVVVPVGDERPSAMMVDMPRLAAKYPSVKAALEATGLTAEQHEAYRIALISARVSRFSGDKPIPMRLLGAEMPGRVMYGMSPPLQPGLAQAQNLEFTNANLEEFKALVKVGMWYTP